MDALSALASIAASNTIAGVAVPDATGAAANQIPTPASPVSPGTSVSVFLSDFARGLLTQQASDPTLDIDTAFAQGLLGLTPGSANNGQLYTSTGLLQPFARALSTSTADTTTQPDTVGVVEQAALTSEEALLNTQNATTARTASAITAQPVAAPAVTVPTPAVNTVASQPEAATDTTAAADTTTAASTQITNTDNGIVIPRATSSADDLDPTTADIRDPYQQAALASGVSSFGKELNSFIPAATDDLQAVIQGIAAIMPVGAIGSGRNDSTEFWLNTRR